MISSSLLFARKNGYGYIVLLVLMLASCGRHKDIPVTQQRFMPIADSRICYETTGEGEALIFLHGGFMDRTMWQNQVDELAGQYQVITLDMRGHGLTVDGDSSYYMYEAVHQLMDTLRIKRATVVGLSLGAIIATDFALEYPEYTERLVLVTPGIHTWEKEVPGDSLLRKNAALMEKAIVELKDTALAAEYFIRAWYDGPQRQPSETDTLARRKMLAIAAAMMQTHRLQFWTRFAAIPATTRLKEIRVPVLLIEGEKDNLSIKVNCDTLMSSLANARRVVINDTAHLPNIERHEEFNRVLMEFLRNTK